MLEALHICAHRLLDHLAAVPRAFGGEIRQRLEHDAIAVALDVRDPGAVALAHETEEQMLRADVAMAELA